MGYSSTVEGIGMLLFIGLMSYLALQEAAYEKEEAESFKDIKDIKEKLDKLSNR